MYRRNRTSEERVAATRKLVETKSSKKASGTIQCLTAFKCEGISDAYRAKLIAEGYNFI